MRSITQTIVLDRLQRALASRGVDLRRSAVLEIAAEAFGFQDGNAFVAAMKEGRFDPPQAEPVATARLGDRDLTILHDPLSAALYALDMTAVPETSRKARLGVSPYGGLLLLPGEVDQAALKSAKVDPAPATPAADAPEATFVVDPDGHSTDPEVAAWRRLIDRERHMEVECEPIGCVDVQATRMARIGGRLFFAFEFGEEYANHGAGVATARDYSAYVAQRAPFFERLGGSIRWEDDTSYGRVEATAFLPADVARNVDDVLDWHDAVSILLGAEHEQVTARFNPQVWINDNAIDADELGEADYDVTVEVLLMGAAAARAMRDNSLESDDLQFAAMAPDWIRNWGGPFYVEVADSTAEYLEQRELLKDETQPEDDSECNDCGQRIDYDTGICTGCGRDHNEEAHDGGVDPGALRAVLPDDAARLLRQTDAGDPV
jgi:predicted Fe-S protein YdhL (DUF1289 family)